MPRATTRLAGVVAACIALYVGAYLVLCLRAGDDTDRYGGTGEPLHLRGYRWSWCGAVFAPAARAE